MIAAGLLFVVDVQALQGPAPSAAYKDGFVTNEGRRVHYLDWGTPGRPAFIMLHGLTRSGHTYDHIAPHFTRDYRVIAMDLRGHGESDWHPNAAYTVEELVKDLEVLVNELGLRNVVLTGSSTGGRVAQVYAGLHPERVAKLIVEDVGPERGADVGASLSERAKREMEGWSSEEELLSSLRRNPTRVSEEIHRNYIRHETKRLANGRLVWKYDPNASKGASPTELWEYVKRIKAPTLYLLGANSRIVPPATQERLKATSSNIKIVTVPEAGHFPHEETPQVFVAIVAAFLAG
jgi:pimeloyl-ACP methyl ester carboxylesterase